MEAAVLRVRRKRGAEPAEALIISCKKPRVEKEESAPAAVTTQVFKLAATVTSQHEPVQQYVQDAISRDRTSQVHRPPIGSVQQIQKDLRALKDAERQESRYRLVSSLRPKCDESDNSQPASPVEEQPDVPETSEASAKDEIAAKGEKDEAIQVFDVVQEETEEDTADPKACDPETIMCNSVTMIRERLTVSQEGQGSEHRENPEEFVYDIYYAESSAQHWIQDILSVQPYYCEPELVAADEPEEVYEDEDDENEENNWRNDYPDEEEEGGSDQEERYMGYYEDSDDGPERSRGDAWDAYWKKAQREYDEEEEDSD
ncbi:hypothetical protein GDO78_013691 [Eleutherodactylus coqui]|uniref:Probable RNA polymerase II nuclear localization protein SLC7A6OS n=1 Tax=Eleutherodactylus coqui TaxID=57060 RepID=A0A8J6JR00_ELECQ|nr:hypothetical protein GDO78_013691 [Eleutherodactylus coqui]